LDDNDNELSVHYFNNNDVTKYHVWI
jgi:hypothetical protein